jgi:hypothetical protein
MHYGVRVSYNAEECHSGLKGFLHTSTGDLKFIVDSFKLWILKKQSSITLRALSRIKGSHRKPLFFKLLNRVLPFVLDLILDQLEIIKKEGFRSEDCANRFTITHGLPCAHKVYKMEANEQLTMRDIDLHW